MKKNSSVLAVLLSAILFLSSCADNSKRNDELFNMLSEGIENSTNRISINTEEILKKIKDKLQDPTTSEKASIWFPKADLVTGYTADIFDYIKNLKTKDNLNSQEAKELYNKLIKLKVYLFLVDSSIRSVFEKKIIFFSRSFDTTANQLDNFYSTFFKNTSHAASLAVLNRFQNNIKIIENEILYFCFINIGSTDGAGLFDQFSAIVIQNSTILKPGQFLEISAGVGELSVVTSPQFVINRKIIKPNEIGLGVYKIKVPVESGNYSIPVAILYTDQNGVKQTVTKTIDYTVAKECDQ
jgi:hypothetical protein